jgi:outer membrane protein OmpA-like peptidoglycan-associated protein
LVRAFSLPAARVRIEGHGKRDLIYQAHDEAKQALNRRVEVSFE